MFTNLGSSTLILFAGLAPELTLIELIAKLEARDRRVEQLFLPYTARNLGATDGNLVWEERGWWLYSGPELAYGIRTTAGANRGYELHGTLIGDRSRELQARSRDVVPTWERAASPGEPQGASPARLAVGGPGAAEALRIAHVPGAFGLRLVQRPWPQHLSGSRTVRLLGVEEIDGKPCLGVLLELSAGAAPPGGGFRTPVVAHFDGQGSLLAVRVRTFLNPDAVRALGATEASIEQHSLELDGKPWVTFQEWSVRETLELAPGVHVARRGELAHPALPDLDGASMILDGDGVRLNVTPPAHLLEVHAPPHSSLQDRTRGEDLFFSAEGHLLTPQDLEFRRLLAHLGATLPADRDPGSQPFGQSSCGPNALLLLAILRGQEPIRLQAILDALPASERRTGITNLGSLAAAGRKVGLELSARELPFSQALGLDGPFLAHLDLPDQPEGHFAVVLSDPARGEVTVLSPPDRFERFDPEQLEPLWTGRVLVLAGAAGMASSGALGAGVSRGLWLAGLVALLGWGLAARAKQRRPVSPPGGLTSAAMQPRAGQEVI